jgi:hypothetical protein
MVGSEVVVSGKVKHFGRRLTLDNPEFQVVADDTELLHAGRIVPVYPLTAGLTSIRLRAAIREALDKAGYAYPEYLPAPIVTEEGLVPIVRAIEEAHYPDSFEGRDAALRRLAFDELLALQLGMVARRRQRVRDAAPEVTLDEASDGAVRTALVDSLRRRVGQPVDLTVDQAVAMSAIREDLARPTSMLRLLQGDVGSGKTAVAAYALAATARPVRQAPCADRRSLARQHLETLGALLEDVGIGVTLSPDRSRPTSRPRRSRRSRRARRSSSSARPPDPGGGDPRRPRPGRHRRAASFGVDQRGQLARPGGGRRARPADDRRRRSADARQGPVPPTSTCPTSGTRPPARVRIRTGVSDRATSMGRGTRSARRRRSGTGHSSSYR